MDIMELFDLAEWSATSYALAGVVAALAVALVVMSIHAAILTIKILYGYIMHKYMFR